MTHLTLNTRHSRYSPREEVSPAVLAAIRPLLASGRHALPGPPGYDLVVDSVEDALIATVYRHRTNAPLVTLGVAAGPTGADELWTLLVDLIEEAPGLVVHGADTPLEQPAETPWCGVVVLHPTREESAWLGDLERCLAWAWIDLVESQS